MTTATLGQSQLRIIETIPITGISIVFLYLGIRSILSFYVNAMQPLTSNVNKFTAETIPLGIAYFMKR